MNDALSSSGCFQQNGCFMKFSIITCSFNNLAGLKAARAQVLAQKGVEVEHIVIDGGSTDGTEQWLGNGDLGMRIAECGLGNAVGNRSSIRNLQSSIRNPKSEMKWLCEPDCGLYDALNKGLRLATGDVVGILHTDDVWEHDEVLARVAEGFGECRMSNDECRMGGDLSRKTTGGEAKGTASGTRLESLVTRHSSLVTPPDAVYGDLFYVDASDISRVRRVWRSGSYDARKWSNGWMPPHPALFVRRDAALRVGEYRLDLGSAADYEWMLRAGRVTGLRFAHLPELLVRMRVGGQSNANVGRRLKAHDMDRRAWELNGLRPRPWTLKMKLLRKLPQWVCALWAGGGRGEEG
jgi:glycosyltransferase